MHFLLFSFLLFASGLSASSTSVDNFHDMHEIELCEAYMIFPANLMALAWEDSDSNKLIPIVAKVIAAELAMATVGLIVVPQLLYINAKVFKKISMLLAPFTAANIMLTMKKKRSS